MAFFLYGLIAIVALLIIGFLIKVLSYALESAAPIIGAILGVIAIGAFVYFIFCAA